MKILDLIKLNFKSGLTISLISIPVSISLAVASGVDPKLGIITAIWAGLLASFFGGSNYNIIGPTGALSGIIASYVMIHGPEMVNILAIIAGFFIIIAYLFKFEKYLIFIPSSVIHGFTLGVALIIIFSQLNFALGLSSLTKHEKSISNIIETFNNIGNFSYPAIIIFMFFFTCLLLLKRFLPSIPGLILLSPVGILVGYLIKANIIIYNVDTLESKFGQIAPILINKPTINFNFLNSSLIISAMIVAFIAIIETMLSAKIADGITKTKHNSRKELFGLGIANIGSGLLGGMPATAALTRTALNIKSGATSIMSAGISSVLIGAGSILMLSYFKYMPLAVIAAILMNIAINMIEREHFYRLWKHDKRNFIVALLVTFITLFEDPIFGILFGVMIALLVLINTLSKGHYDFTIHFNDEHPEVIKDNEIKSAKNSGIFIYSFKGTLAYINSQSHIMRFESDFTQYPIIILRLRELYFIDLDGIDALEEIIEIIEKRKQKVLIAEPDPYIKNLLENSSKKIKHMQKAGLIFDNLKQALEFAKVR